MVKDPIAMKRLLQDADAKAFFTTAEQGSEDLYRRYGLPTIAIPSLGELLAPGVTPRYLFTKTFAEAALDPVLVSPLPCKHRIATAFGKVRLMGKPGLPHLRHDRLPKSQGLDEQPHRDNGHKS